MSEGQHKVGLHSPYGTSANQEAPNKGEGANIPPVL